MIFVQRIDPPEGFEARSTNWMVRYRAAKTENEQLTISQFWSRVRSEIRADATILLNAFNGKCAFCESYMDHVSAPHIEHYRPKGNEEFQHLTFEWNNWLISCGRCNSRKWEHFPYCDNVPCLLNPCEDSPEQHITFTRSISISRSHRGAETIKLVSLNRSSLETARAKWLTLIDCLLLLCLFEDSKEASRNLLIWSLQKEAPYTAMTRAYLQEKTPLLANRNHSHINIQEPLEQISQLLELYQDRISDLL